MQADKKPTDRFVGLFEAALPEGVAEALRSNIRAAASSAFERMNLVSREELDVQQRVLLRTREKLEQLGAQVAELERQLLNK